MLRAGLTERGHAVVTASTVEEGRRLLDGAVFDALVMEQEQSGVALGSHRPAIVTFAAATSGSGSAFIAELAERVAAVARRHRAAAVDHFNFGPYQLNISKRRLYRDHAEVTITRSEYLLLRTLAMNRGEAVSRRQLMQAVWGTATMSHGALDTLVNTVRGKLSDDRPGRISVVQGSGYALVDDPPREKVAAKTRHRHTPE